jgi:hypothetical protein
MVRDCVSMKRGSFHGSGHVNVGNYPLTPLNHKSLLRSLLIAKVICGSLVISCTP